MSKAIRMHEVGGPGVLKWESVPTPQPGPTEALIRHAAVGLNYIDVYFRTGLYKTALPATPGLEGAGVVLAVGAEVKDL
jgi:NADPH2:quinone reductase